MGFSSYGFTFLFLTAGFVTLQTVLVPYSKPVMQILSEITNYFNFTQFHDTRFSHISPHKPIIKRLSNKNIYECVHRISKLTRFT